MCMIDMIDFLAFSGKKNSVAWLHCIRFCPFFGLFFTFTFVKMETYKLGRKTGTEIGPNKRDAWNHSLYGRKNGC